MNKASRLFGALHSVNWWCSLFGGGALFLMAILACYQVFLRYVFKAPVSWAIEVPEYLMLVGAAMALAFTQEVRGHIAVGFIESRLSARQREILTLALYPIFLGVVIFLSWSVFRLTISSVIEGRATRELQLPLVIPMSFLFIGAAMFSLQVIVDVIKLVSTIKQKGWGTTLGNN